jgi:hypothetical protein
MSVFGRMAVMLVVAGFAGNLGAQGLGDAAQREKERRAKVKAEKPPAKTYGEEELKTAKGSTYSQPEGPAVTSSTSSTSETISAPVSRPSAGSPGAARAAQANSVAQLERRVSDLEKRRATLPPGPFGPSIPCQEGTIVTNGSTAIQLRDAPKTKVCDPNLLREQEARRVQIELDEARAALERARKQ